MSEILTSPELSASKDKPTTPEMGELRKITTLQDIPLAEGDIRQQIADIQPDDTDNDMERKLKTSSLKRFFRLPTKKKTGHDDGPLEGATSHMEFEEGAKINRFQQNPTPSNNDCTGDLDLNPNLLEYKRFKLNYGHYESKSNTAEHRPKANLSGSFSKATLKSSLSTYWNSVFKLKKSRKSSKSTHDEDPGATASTESALTLGRPNDLVGANNAEDSNVLDDIQSLNISEEGQHFP